MSKAKISWKTVLLYRRSPCVRCVAAMCLTGRCPSDCLWVRCIPSTLFGCGDKCCNGDTFRMATCFARRNQVRCSDYFCVVAQVYQEKIQKLNLLLYLVASNVFYCVYGTADYFALFDKILYSLCGIAFSFVCIYFFRAVFAWTCLPPRHWTR